jgi:hypothetical protein
MSRAARAGRRSPIARAYPNARVDGIDLDEPAIEQADATPPRPRSPIASTFHARDAADPALEGAFDLSDGLRGRARHVATGAVLGAARRLLARAGR